MAPATPLTLAQRLQLRWMVWTLPRLVRRLPLTHLLADMLPSAVEPAWQLPPARTVAAVQAALARPFRMRGRPCLREGLAAFHFLRRGGHAAVLHFGVDRNSTRKARIRGHCWVSLDGEILLNPPAPEFVELFAYSGQALPQPQAGRRAAALGF